jgi:hypothetical protein
MVFVHYIGASHFRLLHLEGITYAMGCTHLPHLMSQAVMPPEKQFIVEECGQCFRGIVSMRTARQDFVTEDCFSWSFDGLYFKGWRYGGLHCVLCGILQGACISTL